MSKWMPHEINQRWIRSAVVLGAIAAQIFALRLDWKFDTQTHPDLQTMNVRSQYSLLLEGRGDTANNTLLHYQASALHNHFVTLEMASARLSDQSQSYLSTFLPPRDASQVAYAPERSGKPQSGTPCRAMFDVDFAPQKTPQPRSVHLYPPLATSPQLDNVRSINLESSSELVIRVSANSDDEQRGPGCRELLTMGKWEQLVGANLELSFLAVPNSRVTLSLSPDLKGPLHSSREELDSLLIEPLNPLRLSIGPYGLAQPDQIRDRAGQPFLAVKDLGLGGDFFNIQVSGLVGVPISEVLGAWTWLLFAGINLPLLFWLSKAFSKRPTRRSSDTEDPAMEPPHKAGAFLSYSWEDKSQVMKIYHLLKSLGAELWIDRQEIRGGAEWELSIREQMRESQRVVIFLSSHSIRKAGFAWAEIRMAVRIAEQQPEGTPFIIPVKLDKCRLPELLSRWDCIDLFEPEGHQKLMGALGLTAKNQSASTQSSGL
jgi:hypothetical protein